MNRPGTLVFLALVLVSCAARPPAPEPEASSSESGDEAGRAARRGAAAPAAKPAQDERISPELLRLHEEHARHLDSAGEHAFRPSSTLFQIRDQRVAVDFAPNGDLDALVRDLEELGVAGLVAVPAQGGASLASGWLPIAAIPELSRIDTLRIARAALAVTHGNRL